VVIDNTNPTPDVRARYTKIAKELKVPVRCFYFDVDKKVCMHNNLQRKNNEHREHLSGKVPDIPIHSFFKNHVKPDAKKEDFDEVRVIDFKAGPFESEEDKDTYYQLS
jgi:bifunctional polynucleotide phosphatase/kinase